MTWTPTHHVLDVASPASTLAIMGRTAMEAADTWTVREWAARLATQAKRRDYVDQLRKLYDGILARWRYVQEPGEWVHSSARSLLAHVLGLKYNTDTDPRHVELSKVSAKHKGWGDCDDVAMVVAAGALALGMQPMFRVVRGNNGGAHVSVMVRTPRGQVVSVDPVGAPQHPFGWLAPGDSEEFYDLQGQPTDVVFSGSDNMQGSTFFAGVEGIASRPTRQHWVAAPFGDVDGPRVLAMPKHLHRIFKSGHVVHRAPAIDERGNQYLYDARRDLWLDRRLARGPLGQVPDHMGGVKDFFKRVKRRTKKRFAVVRRVVKRVVQGVRNVLAKILNSKAAQAIVGNVLRMYGVPAKLTKGVMAAASSILKKGGLIGLVKMLRKDPKAVGRLVAQATRAGLKGAASFKGPDDGGPNMYWVREPGCRPYVAQPVSALAGVPFMYAYGAVDVSDVPTPGSYYRFKRGDTLLGVASKAYGTKSGTSANLQRARWINEAVANRGIVDPSLKDNLFPKGRVSLSPKFASDADAANRGERGNAYAVAYLPLGPGDEPPEITPDVSTDDDGPVIPPMPPPVIPPTTDQPPLPPPGPVSPPTTVPPTMEPPPTPQPPSQDSFSIACVNTGGQVVTLANGSRGCVKCGPAEVWSDAAGRCIPRITGGQPPVIDDGLPEEFCARGQTRVRLPDGDRCLPDAVASAAEECMAAGYTWTPDNRCIPPGFPPPTGPQPPFEPPSIDDGLPEGFCPRGMHAEMGPDGKGVCVPDVVTPPPVGPGFPPPTGPQGSPLNTTTMLLLAAATLL